MADDIAKSSPLEEFLNELMPHGVELLVIGGQVAALHGSTRPTHDVDLCYRRSEESIHRLARALAPLKPGLRGAPPGLPFRFDAKTLMLGSNFAFETAKGPLNLLGYVEPLGDFDAAAKNAVVMALGAWQVKVLSLDDLIRVKQHIGRPKDLDSLMYLHAIKRVRDEELGGAP